MQKKIPLAHRPLKPERMLALGFLTVILMGSLLLSLPVCAEGGTSIGLRQSLFTATSAVCVTGLSLIDAGTQLSGFGQVVLLALIQVGGLGFMSFATVIMAALGKRISLKGRMLLRDSMNQTTLRGMVRLSLIFFGLAMAIEMAGALLLMIRLVPLYGMRKGMWYSFFTAISAFCNAGFDVFGGGKSLTHFYGEPVVLLTVSALIILGGLGFTVILECLQHRFRFQKLSVHAKMVLAATGVLLITGTVLTLLLESRSALKEMQASEKILNSFFQAVTLRTAGFASVDQGSLTDTGKLMSCLWMFVGASSASTGGGIKTTTTVMMILLVWNVIRGEERINVFGREISMDTARRSMAIALLGMAVVLLSAGIISAAELGRGFSMMDILFETVSAFSTTGLSALNTSNLSPVSHWLLMPLMYLGRVGPLTLAFALANRQQSAAAARVRYPEEKIMIG